MLDCCGAQGKELDHRSLSVELGGGPVKSPSKLRKFLGSLEKAPGPSQTQANITLGEKRSPHPSFFLPPHPGMHLPHAVLCSLSARSTWPCWWSSYQGLRQMACTGKDRALMGGSNSGRWLLFGPAEGVVALFPWRGRGRWEIDKQVAASIFTRISHLVISLCPPCGSLVAFLASPLKNPISIDNGFMTLTTSQFYPSQ